MNDSIDAFRMRVGIMSGSNWLAILVAGVLGYFPGALWYSKAMFLQRWASELGIDLANPPPNKHGGLRIAIGLVPSIAAAAIFSLILGPAPALAAGLLWALACAIGLVGTSFAIQYIYEDRSPAFWAITTGYHLVQFLIFAIVLTLWP
jgi:hypothetical protein